MHNEVKRLLQKEGRISSLRHREFYYVSTTIIFSILQLHGILRKPSLNSFNISLLISSDGLSKDSGTRRISITIFLTIFLAHCQETVRLFNVLIIYCEFGFRIRTRLFPKKLQPSRSFGSFIYRKDFKKFKLCPTAFALSISMASLQSKPKSFFGITFGAYF